MEFHIGDAVVSKHNVHFVVKGVQQGPRGLLYSGDNTGWTAEEDLDYDMSENQRELLRPLEHSIQTMRVTIEGLVRQIDQVRSAFYGILPQPIRRELAVLSRLMGDNHAYPGKMEKTDLLILIASARNLRQEALRYANEAGRFPDKELRAAMTSFEDAANIVEELL
jgi:hypothetical protein